MTTWLVAHGAWSAGWAWKKMHARLRAHGDELVVPTYTGLGERLHLARSDIDLSTHVADLLGVVEYRDLRDFVLIGHSYGGMVASALADRLAERVRALVYLDAFVPRDGESLFDLIAPAARARMREAARTHGEGWRVPPNPTPADTDPADVAWITPRRVFQPMRTFEEPVKLSGALEGLPRTYIYCTRVASGDPFRVFAESARAAAGWRYLEIDASHSPHITCPDLLTELLISVASRDRQ